ncbi:MAG TPA: M56 family metallopeptidase [Sphingopyxis sp.]|uniref:M56 family metallopeptidase n=1 Tax=Sphingopyxis sp. TaxID=1908224 RepID=UPI002E30D6D5|nr:M56 family metallopeptidase [Sphingopyxis sp.]HEX2811377.1 M56 family metallopeptidase [Sphingopyxis sp.]
MITTAMLLGLAWKSAAVAGLTLILLRLARSRSSGERSLIAHAGIVALLALPAAMLLLPAWAPLPESWTAAPVAAAPAAPASAAPLPAAAPAASATADTASFALPEVGDLAPFLYAIPLALLCGMMLLAVVRLFAMRGRAEVLTEGSWLSALAEAQRRMGFKHGTALLVSRELRSPISWGVLRPTIVLSPVTVDAVDEAEAIIAHELAHVARLDWAKLLGARAVCALFWFNPLVWMLARESHQLREEAADDAVLMADIDGPDYASLLVGAARHDNQGALLAAHGVAPGKGSLKRRITRVLDGSLKRGPASVSWMLMSLVLLAGVTAPLAAFSATAESNADLDRAAKDSPVPFAAAAPAAPQSTAAAGGNQGGEAAPAAAAPKPLTADQLVGMRAVGVTPEYVAKMREHGGSMDPDDIIAAKAVGVDPAYIRAMRGVFPGASMDDLIGASALHIEPGYAREMKGEFGSLSIDDLTALRAMGVTGDYIRKMRGAGYALKSPDDAVELRATGMTRGVMRKSTSRRDERATVDISRGVIEARGADGRVARVEFPAPPEPPAAPEN